MKEFAISIWLVQGSLLLPAWWWILRHHELHPRIAHIRLISTAFVILAWIDVYTICCENYPVRSLKSAAMLVAFGMADFSLIRLLFDSLKSTGHEKGSR